MTHLVRIFFLLQAIFWGSTPILWAKELAAYPISLQRANDAPAGLYRDNTWGDQLMAYAEKEFPADQYYWDWAQAPLLRSIADRWENGMNQESMLSYIRKAMDVNMDKAGGIHPNVLASGFGMAFLARITGEQRYREKAFELYRQYLQIPRSSNGGVSHRDHVIELWDDTVYMISLFLTEMYRLTGDEQFLKELAFQLTAHAEKLEDSKTGLWYHGWDNDLSAFDDKCCMPGWADNPNRRNSEFWGRGNGWVAMTFANTLRVMPDNMEEKKALKQKFVRMMQTLSGLQDKKTGHWYQLPFRPGERGNFIESSGTAMFAYAMSVGVAEKLLEKRRYMPIIKNAFRGIGKYSLKPVDGLLTVANVCYGTCIGNKTYYYARKVVEGTPFTLGAAIMFYDQYNILIDKKKRMRTINDYRLLVVLCLLVFPAGIFAQPATGSVQVREDNVRSNLLNVTRQYTVCPPCNAYITLVTPDCIKTTPKRTEPNQFNHETK